MKNSIILDSSIYVKIMIISRMGKSSLGNLFASLKALDQIHLGMLKWYLWLKCGYNVKSC